MKNTSMTLMEMMIVLVIIGVLSTLGITHYGAYRERAFDKEAQANLRLIGAAERIWRMESNDTQYLDCPDPAGGTACINTNLRLMLPTVNPAWNYSVAAVAGTSFCARAARTLLQNNYWHLHGSPGQPDTVPERGDCHP